MGKFLLLSAVLIAMLSSVRAQQPDSTEPAKAEDTTTPTKTFKKETASSLTVEAKLCTSVVDRKAQGEAIKFGSEVGQVYLWCRVNGATDTTHVEHLWYYKGEEKASIKLPVKAASWRTWSKKTIMPHWTGQWEVKIVDADWHVLKTIAFTVE
ncbi:MAG: DUF2914 domain-containing protein [candidate division Zixibacteria bacterium]|nr:DUF2914 domain-containing protein [candidate division Zixibacteria bacterium]MDH3938399.1 DUF2914 domain-containing protein [candidate division Zixibacteria bacterium]MDH4032334.1 DUF2914 domain-containing protein [candidate division Zixibacteria bacterium]